MRRAPLGSALLVLAASCGAPSKPGNDPYAIYVAAAPSGARSPEPPLVEIGSDLVQAKAPPGDVCGKIPATRGSVPHRNADAKRPVAGQMTEEAAQSKRLFDAEKWEDAALALKRVAAGETGDDEGNKQLADYHYAIALYRLKRFDESAARFRTFSRDPGHLKFFETLLWIVKLATTRPDLVRLEDVALYTPEEVQRFNNPNQLDTYGAAAYLVGHERYDEGNLSEASRFFQMAKTVGPWRAEAEKCLARIAKDRR